MSPQQVAAAFHLRYGVSPSVIASAPGRVNLIGEHTDYNEGYVFPAAIDRRTWVAARVVDGPSRVTSEQLGDAEPFEAARKERERIQDWARYAAGMAWALHQARPDDPPPNIEALVMSDLPLASGLSSSAALEMAFAVAWNELAELGLSNRELALHAQRCENEYVGVRCGIMDQMASAMGLAGHAMLIDTRTLDLQYVAPENLTIVVCGTGRPRGLSDSAYNQRRAECDAAARVLDVPCLRDVTLEDLQSSRARMDDVLYRRAHHVVTENQRCVDFSIALRAGEVDEMFRLMRQSHESLRHDYEVSCPELDAMAAAAWAAPGCIGARMTGAGFGGSCVALVEAGRAVEFCADAEERYRNQMPGLQPEFLVCQADNGAGLAEW